MERLIGDGTVMMTTGNGLTESNQTLKSSGLIYLLC